MRLAVKKFNIVLQVLLHTIPKCVNYKLTCRSNDGASPQYCQPLVNISHENAKLTRAAPEPWHGRASLALISNGNVYFPPAVTAPVTRAALRPDGRMNLERRILCSLSIARHFGGWSFWGCPQGGGWFSTCVPVIMGGTFWGGRTQWGVVAGAGTGGGLRDSSSSALLPCVQAVETRLYAEAGPPWRLTGGPRGHHQDGAPD